MPIIDITQPLTPAIAVWPGDRPFSFEWTARLEEGSSVNIGSVSMSTHTGTHLDAPLHYAKDGSSVDDYPLDLFIGRALVIDVRGCGQVKPSHVSEIEHERVERVLLKTRQEDNPNEWDDEFAAIHPNTIRCLALHGVRLIGTDAPSVDSADSQELPAHHMLMQYGIANLENLALETVAPGLYQLVALPLKLCAADAAPVRAVLMT